MADVWGLMPKSQDDPETIEEAITRIVGEHNDSATAHSDTGQSLDVHRKSEVIDHLAGSILADKQSSVQRSVTNALLAVASMSQVGDVIDNGVGSVRLYIETPYTNVSSVTAEYSNAGVLLTTAFDMYYQALVQFDTSNTSFKSYWGFLANSTSTAVGFGFNVRSNVLRAHAGDGTHNSEVTISGIDLTQEHTYRAFYIAGEGQFYFYVDGVLEAQIAKGSIDLDQTANVTASIEETATNDGNMFLSFVNYASGN